MRDWLKRLGLQLKRRGLYTLRTELEQTIGPLIEDQERLNYLLRTESCVWTQGGLSFLVGRLADGQWVTLKSTDPDMRKLIDQARKEYPNA